jgi:hypothetical protein
MWGLAATNAHYCNAGAAVRNILLGVRRRKNAQLTCLPEGPVHPDAAELRCFWQSAVASTGGFGSPGIMSLSDPVSHSQHLGPVGAYIYEWVGVAGPGGRS